MSRGFQKDAHLLAGAPDLDRLQNPSANEILGAQVWTAAVNTESVGECSEILAGRVGSSLIPLQEPTEVMLPAQGPLTHRVKGEALVCMTSLSESPFYRSSFEMLGEK